MTTSNVTERLDYRGTIACQLVFKKKGEIQFFLNDDENNGAFKAFFKKDTDCESCS